MQNINTAAYDKYFKLIILMMHVVPVALVQAYGLNLSIFIVLIAIAVSINLIIINFHITDLRYIFIQILLIKYITATLYIKIYHGQSLEQGLTNPLESYLISTAPILILALVILKKPNQLAWCRNIDFEIQSNAMYYSLAFYIIGVASYLSGIYLSGPLSNLGLFLLDFQLLSIFLFWQIIFKGNVKISVKLFILLLSGIALLMALLMGSRAQIFEIMIAIFFASMIYGSRASKVKTSLFAAFTFLIVAAITPQLLQMRYTMLQSQSIVERASILISGDRSSTPTNQRSEFDPAVFRLYGYENNIAARFSLLEHVDHAIDANKRVGNLGLEPLRQSATMVVPGVFGVEKLIGQSYGDHLNCLQGIRCLPGGYATVPVNAEGYALFGQAGGLLLPPIALAPFIWLLIALGGNRIYREKSILIVFFILSFLHIGTEANTASLFVYMLRTIPQYVLTILLIIFLRQNIQKILSRRAAFK